VFHIALSLAFSAVSLAQPAASVSTNAAIAVCFAPEEDCAAFAVRAIDNAEHEILVSAYGLTVGSGVVGALIGAKERGVDVKLIADRSTPCGRGSGVEPLAAAGVPIWIDHHARIAHAKTMVIDGDATLMGSMNWTNGAVRSSEDLNLVASRPVAQAYAAHWRERLAVSSPFARRADWCRVSSSSVR
jgi:phospholipase D